MTSLKFNHPILVYDSHVPIQHYFFNDLKRKNNTLKEIEINACPVPESLLLHILENVKGSPSRILINEKSPWYRCFAEDFIEMNQMVLLQTLTNFPSLLKTPIVVLENEIIVAPNVENFSYSNDEVLI